MILRKWEGRIELSIEDNGQGFDPRKVLDGRDIRREMGLASMKERSELSGGFFSLCSSESKGTAILVSWPAGSVHYSLPA